MSADYADRVIAVVREHLPLLDADDLDEVRDAIVTLGDLPGPEVKSCPACEWFGSTTSTHCGQCGTVLRRAAG